jgi:hypothetical protein
MDDIYQMAQTVCDYELEKKKPELKRGPYPKGIGAGPDLCTYYRPEHIMTTSAREPGGMAAVGIPAPKREVSEIGPRSERLGVEFRYNTQVVLTSPFLKCQQGYRAIFLVGCQTNPPWCWGRQGCKVSSRVFTFWRLTSEGLSRWKKAVAGWQ